MAVVKSWIAFQRCRLAQSVCPRSGFDPGRGVWHFSCKFWYNLACVKSPSEFKKGAPKSCVSAFLGSRRTRVFFLVFLLLHILILIPHPHPPQHHHPPAPHPQYHHPQHHRLQHHHHHHHHHHHIIIIIVIIIIIIIIVIIIIIIIIIHVIMHYPPTTPTLFGVPCRDNITWIQINLTVLCVFLNHRFCSIHLEARRSNEVEANRNRFQRPRETTGSLHNPSKHGHLTQTSVCICKYIYMYIYMCIYIYIYV